MRSKLIPLPRFQQLPDLGLPRFQLGNIIFTTSIDTGTYLPSCKLTVGEWLNTWISEYTADWKPLTVCNYSKQIKKHLIPRLGAAKLEDLDTHTIQLFYNSLTKSGLAPKTVKNIHGVLHAALEQAISNGYISKNPTAGCKLPKVVRPEIKPLEPEEIARMLKEIGRAHV